MDYTGREWHATPHICTFSKRHGDVSGPDAAEGVQARANKLTCGLSPSEPRDLVDLLFVDRAGYPPEADLTLALATDLHFASVRKNQLSA